jgi:hypothetical protein
MKSAIVYVFLLVLIGIGCTPGKVLKMSDTQKVFFLDSMDAARFITHDEADDFFDKVNELDMSIQMKKTFEKGTSRNEMVNAYKQYLKEDVESFTADEKKLLKKIMKKAYKDCQEFTGEIFLPEIQLVKTKGNHYGAGAYYTRENRIVIPADAINLEGERSKSDISEALYRTMLHELFHVYSRYHPKEKRQLYSLIGFKNIFGLPLSMDKALEERILINPDGVDISQVIDLKTDTSTISAIPIIIANRTSFNPNTPEFFSYLKFDMYQVTRVGKAIRVISNNDGTSTIDVRQYPDFFKQIKDNTNYIIHPDEIMADNFMLAVSGAKQNAKGQDFSEEGKELIEQVKMVLRGNFDKIETSNQ